MSIYIPQDNHIDDYPIQNSENVDFPYHFTVGKSKPEHSKESENNG